MRTRPDRVTGADKSRGSRMVLAGLTIGVVGLAVVAVVLALQPTTELDPATPEGAVQGYLRTVLDDDGDLARTYLTQDLAARCQSIQLHELREGSAGAVIISSRPRGDQVRIDVRITETDVAEPFGGSSYSFEETFVLEPYGEGWLITEPPWPIHYCPEASP